MVEIGGKPILWHILKIYSAQGINDFVICWVYKGCAIKEYFANYEKGQIAGVGNYWELEAGNAAFQSLAHQRESTPFLLFTVFWCTRPKPVSNWPQY
jgi:hypothetical protein